MGVIVCEADDVSSDERVGKLDVTETDVVKLVLAEKDVDGDIVDDVSDVAVGDSLTSGETELDAELLSERSGVSVAEVVGDRRVLVGVADTFGVSERVAESDGSIVNELLQVCENDSDSETEISLECDGEIDTLLVSVGSGETDGLGDSDMESSTDTVVLFVGRLLGV